MKYYFEFFNHFEINAEKSFKKKTTKIKKGLEFFNTDTNFKFVYRVVFSRRI